MSPNIRHIVLFVLACLPICCASAAAPLEGSPGVLVLHNGNVLKGRITRVNQSGSPGDCLVAWATGIARVASKDIELVCDDLDDAYRQKRNKLINSTVESQHDFARWCMNQELYGYAARELMDARQRNPNHPALELLERQLEHLASPAPRIARNPAKAAPVSTNDKLDQLVLQIPEGSLQRFAKETQPILVNSCATAGCHSSHGKNPFRLEQIGRNRSSGHRLTQRNLLAVLKYIHQDDPARSPLLIEPSRPHGGSATPVFTSRNAKQYAQLVAWVQDVQSSGIDSQDGADRHVENIAQGRTGTSRKIAKNVPKNLAPRGRKNSSASKLLAPRDVAAQRNAKAPLRASAAKKNPYGGSSFFPWQARQQGK